MTVCSMTRSKVKVMSPFKVGNPAVFKCYLLCSLQWELATDHGFLNWDTISKFDPDGFLIFGLVFLCNVTLKLAQTSIAKSRPSVLVRG